MGDRIITSRMVRRWKPGETLEATDTPKSRWCVHGHKDPDALGLEVFAPTPQGLAFVVYVQMLSSLGMLVDVADVKGAFTQGDPLRRAGGQIYAEPCEGGHHRTSPVREPRGGEMGSSSKNGGRPPYHGDRAEGQRGASSPADAWQA